MQLKKALILVLLCAMLLTVASATFAQEAPNAETPTSSTEAPAGLGTLVLLMGLGAVVLVGGVMVARENFKAGDDTD